MEKQNIQLYVIAALWIASKFHDEEEFFDMKYLCKKLELYSQKDLERAEREMFFTSMTALQMKTVIDASGIKTLKDLKDRMALAQACVVYTDSYISVLSSLNITPEIVRKYKAFKDDLSMDFSEIHFYKE